MTPRIILHNEDTAPLEDLLLKAYPDADYRSCNSYEALPGEIEAFRPEIVYSVRFAGTPGFPKEALFGPHGPAWVANGGAGIDHFGTWDPSKVTVTNAAGVAADMMAEYVFGGFLHFTLDVPGLQSDKTGRVWRMRTVRPLAGKVLLIVGLGHTGQAIAARAKAFGMKVLATRAHPQPADNVDEVHAAGDLPLLLPHADFIAICTPLTAQTRKLISAAEISEMKQGVILADVSRGGVVDQGALADALQTGWIAGAALDVFEVEPLPEENPLWELKNVLISPHCSSVYEGWELASFQLFLKNLERRLQGKALFNVVNPGLGY